MCDQTYTVATETALTANKEPVLFSLIAAIFAAGCLWQARLALRHTPRDGEGSLPRRDWGEFAGSLFAAFLASVFIWAATAGFFTALRFTIDGSEILAVEVDTMNNWRDPPNNVIRTTRLDDSADLCRLIELLQAAPVEKWVGATGTGDEYYRVRFVRMDGTYDMNWLDVVPNGYHEKGINIVLLSRGYHKWVMALHSPAINEWLQSKLAAQ